MTISKLTNIFMYNSDLQCMNANNNISINILVTSEANWKWGGAARPYQKSCQAKKNMSLYMLTLSWACQMSSLQTGSDLEYNSST